jgi:FMN reductase
MTTFTVAVVSAGLSQPSSTRLLADQLADATSRAAQDQGDRVEVINLELRELAHDITNNLLTGFPSVALQSAIDAVTSADALIAVTPVFSASYSGLFKSFFDVLDPNALAGTPVLLAATGGSARHSLVLDYALRPLFSYLKATIAPTGVYAATADFGSDEAGRSLAERVSRATRQLVGLIEPANSGWTRTEPDRVVDAGWTRTGPDRAANADLGPGPSRISGRATREPDPFDALVPFEELLARR